MSQLIPDRSALAAVRAFLGPAPNSENGESATKKAEERRDFFPISRPAR